MNKRYKTKLALIVGGGKLPLIVAREFRDAGIPFCVIALLGLADEKTLASFKPYMLGIGQLSRAFKIMREEGVKSVLFLGKVTRPALSEIKPDFAAAKIIGKLLLTSSLGDDTLLRAIDKVFLDAGFTILRQDIALRAMLAAPKLYTKVAPTRDELDDIKHGYKLALKVGALDLYQSLVIEKGVVLSLEGADGTDAAIYRGGRARRETKKSSGIFIKVCKPGQSLRQDLPTIGMDTIQAVHKAGLRGLAVQAGRTVMMEREKIIRYADAHKLFLLGVS